MPLGVGNDGDVARRHHAGTDPAVPVCHEPAVAQETAGGQPLDVGQVADRGDHEVRVEPAPVGEDHSGAARAFEAHRAGGDET